VLLFTAWPFLGPRAANRVSWAATALAALLWFPVLRERSCALGDAAIGALPVASPRSGLAAAAGRRIASE
jgi:hypothetical protein